MEKVEISLNNMILSKNDTVEIYTNHYFYCLSGESQQHSSGSERNPYRYTIPTIQLFVHSAACICSRLMFLNCIILSFILGNKWNADYYCEVFCVHGFFVGSFGNEHMQSCSVRCVVLLVSSSALVSSVYSPPSDSFDHRNFISYKYMYLYP